MDLSLFWNYYHVKKSPGDGSCLIYPVDNSFNAQFSTAMSMNVILLCGSIETERISNVNITNGEILAQITHVRKLMMCHFILIPATIIKINTVIPSQIGIKDQYGTTEVHDISPPPKNVLFIATSGGHYDSIIPNGYYGAIIPT